MPATANTTGHIGDPDVTDAAAPAARTQVDLEFDFSDFHCYIDVDELLAGLTSHGRAAVLAHTPREKLTDADDYDWTDIAAAVEAAAGTAEADEVADALTEDADSIRAELHRGECDCVMVAFDWFTDTLTEQVTEALGNDSYLLAFYPRRNDRDRAVLVEQSFSYAEIVTGLDVDCYDRVRFRLDVAAGTGEAIWYDRGPRWLFDLVVLTDPAAITLATTLAENVGHGYPADHPIREVRDLDPALGPVYALLAATDLKVPAPRPDWRGNTDPRPLNELDVVDFLAAMADLGITDLTDGQRQEVLTLAPNWSAEASDLVAALKAAAA